MKLTLLSRGRSVRLSIGQFACGQDAHLLHAVAVVEVVGPEIVPAVELVLGDALEPKALLERLADDADRLAGAAGPGPIGHLVTDEGEVVGELVRLGLPGAVAGVAPILGDGPGIHEPRLETRQM